MASGLRILITNNTLADRAGSELYVRDLALSLLRRGHAPIAYTSAPGEVAEELRRATVPVLTDLASVGVPPDVIHGQHHLDAMCALLRFPQVPALYVCHGWLPWEELPPVFPSIVRYVAVDDLCRERLETTPGVAAERIRTIYNGVDLRRFLPRSPLPDRPRTALIFSNYASEENFIGTIRSACAAFGIDHVDVIGRGSGNSAPMPEVVLPNYDVVFGKGRCALEALAVGCAAIVADFPGLGGMVTPDNVETMRRLNFGVRTMQAASITVDAVIGELNRFDAARSVEVCAFIRAHADAETTVDQLEALYQEIRAERFEWSAASAMEACEAASTYLNSLVHVTKAQADTEQRNAVTAAWAANQIAALSVDGQRLRSELSKARAQLSAVTAELSAVRNSRTWRAFAGYRHARAWLSRR